MKMLIVFLLGIAIGSGAAVAYLQIAAEPQFIWHSDEGGLMKVTPANTYRAIDMAGEYSKRFRAYPVLTETTLGTIRFDCIPHLELTGPLARPPTRCQRGTRSGQVTTVALYRPEQISSTIGNRFRVA